MTSSPVDYGGYSNSTVVANSTEAEYVVVDELTAINGTQSAALAQLELLAEVANSTDVGSFWVLDRGNSSAELYVFSRFENKAAWQAFDAQTTDLWEGVTKLSESYRRTTWVSHGVGFISR